MGKVIYDVSMSLDGFIAASGMTAEEGLGVGGEVLHEWGYSGGDEQDHEILERYHQFGAHVAGRRTYDYSIKWWGADGLGGRPTIIVSHDVPAYVPGDGVYTFVRGVRTALDTARALAGDKDIQVMGGNITRQFLHEGLVDEIAIHLIPVLLGTGLPLLGEGPSQLTEHITLEQIEVISTRAATHLRYRVIK